MVYENICVKFVKLESWEKDDWDKFKFGVCKVFEGYFFVFILVFEIL